MGTLAKFRAKWKQWLAKQKVNNLFYFILCGLIKVIAMYAKLLLLLLFLLVMLTGKGIPILIRLIRTATMYIHLALSNLKEVPVLHISCCIKLKRNSSHLNLCLTVVTFLLSYWMTNEYRSYLYVPTMYIILAISNVKGTPVLHIIYLSILFYFTVLLTN